MKILIFKLGKIASTFNDYIENIFLINRNILELK